MAQELLKRLETAIANNHKQAYIDTIFDFTDNDILSLTEDEINLIFALSQKINIANIGEFFNSIRNEGLFYFNNAPMCMNELNNTLLCRFYFGLYINLFQEKNKKYALALMHQGVAYTLLSNQGVNSRLNLENAIKLHTKARAIFAQDIKYTPDCARTMVNEANARQSLADIGVESKNNLKRAIKFHKKARDIFAQDTKYISDCAHAMLNEANVRQRLADIGVKSKENLGCAIELNKKARDIFTQDAKYAQDCARTMLNESIARQSLAYINVKSKENLEIAIELCEKARDIFVPDTPNCARTMLSEANDRQSLAYINVKSKENLERAIELYKEARDIFASNTPDCARTMISEASALQILADMGIRSKENLERAIKLCKKARDIFVPDTPDQASTMLNEATARKSLADIGVKSKKNLERAKRLYLNSLSSFKSFNDCVGYSMVLLNLNIFLIGNFRKSGKREYIEEAKTILEDAEKNIKKRDVRNKKMILAKLHENRAILLEFDGRLGIDMAAREYAEAYNLTKEPFYKFMDEFCRSRIDIEPFCILVSKWDETKKDGIFLDYYDYSVFECHIENAVDSKGPSREEEFRAAVKKLQEIRDRTQVKTIKDRVSAYVYLMQAVVDYFRYGSYEAAKNNVRAAWAVMTL